MNIWRDPADDQSLWDRGDGETWEWDELSSDAKRESRWRQLGREAVDKAAVEAAAGLAKNLPSFINDIRARRKARSRVLIELHERGLVLVGACRDRHNPNTALAEFLLAADEAERTLAGRMVGDMQSTGLVSADAIASSLREYGVKAVDAVNAGADGHVGHAAAAKVVDALNV